MAIRGQERLLSERMPQMVVETRDEDLGAACRELLTAHGYSVEPVEPVEPRRWLPEVRTPSYRWLVARGRPPA